MALGKNNNEDGPWMSLSDMMTGLMVIFLFVAISYMVKTNNQQKQRDLIFEEFKATEEELYSELEQEFKDDFKKWEMVLDKDLSIKFTNSDVLFASGKATLTQEFKDFLYDFFPRYFDILLDEKYRKRINEIRIEGHADSSPSYYYDEDSYISNMILSQKRAVAILKYYRKAFPMTSKDKKLKIEFLVTANGLSYGRTLDNNKELTYESGEKENKKLSRRVEFRIMTNSKEVVKKALEQMKK